MPYPLGFNALANNGQVGDEQYYLDTCKRLGSSFQLVMSNPDLASRLYDHCEGKTEVIYRSYAPDDNSLWRSRSAESYGEELVAFKDTRLWLYGLNEPNGVDATEIAYRNQWLVNLIEYVCGGYGRKLVVGNFASGSWELSHIDLGLYDDLLRKIHQYRDICYLGLHEYTAILMPMTYDSIIHGIKDRENVQPLKWLYLDSDDPETLLPDYREERIDWMYHLFRSNWLQHRAADIGIDPVPIVLTEFGTDRLQDVDGQDGIYEYFKNFAGIPEPYAAPHGFYSNYKVWNWYYPQWDTSEALFHQLQWAYMNYDPEWYKGILLFDWGYDTEFSSRGFNLAPDELLHRYLIADSILYHNQTNTPTDNSEDEPQVPKTIDLAQYMVGDGRTYQITYDWNGGGSFINQTQIDAGYFYHVKGYDYSLGYEAMNEQLWYDKNYIYRGYDTSPSLDEMYYIKDVVSEVLVVYGCEWMHRYIQVGDELTTAPLVTFMYKSDSDNWKAGDNVPGKAPYTFEHTIECHAIHDAYTFLSGITLNDVVELWGYVGGVNFEQYFYAKNYGLVAWNDPTKNWHSYISDRAIPANLVRQTLSWFNFPTRGDLPPFEDNMTDYTLDINDERWQEAGLEPLTSNRINIRLLPSTTATVVTTFAEIRLCYTIPGYVANMPDGTWYPVKVGDKDSDFVTGTFDIVGWVRGDVGEVTVLPTTTPDPEPEPDTPSDTAQKFIYIPLPELAASQATLNELADLFGKLAMLAPYLDGLAQIMANWDKTASGEYDGIALIPSEGDE